MAPPNSDVPWLSSSLCPHKELIVFYKDMAAKHGNIYPATPNLEGDELTFKVAAAQSRKLEM